MQTSRTCHGTPRPYIHCTQAEMSHPMFPLQNNNVIRHAITTSKWFRKTIEAETIRSSCKEQPDKAIISVWRLLPSETGIFLNHSQSLRKLQLASRQSFQDKFGREYAPSLMTYGLRALPQKVNTQKVETRSDHLAIKHNTSIHGQNPKCRGIRENKATEEIKAHHNLSI